MSSYFVSFDSRDINLAGVVVDQLRGMNANHEFFWAGDGLTGGKGWFEQLEDNLRRSCAVIGLITSNTSWTKGWINYEIGAACSGEKKRIIIRGPCVNAPIPRGAPLSEIQCIKSSDGDALKKELSNLGLASGDEHVRKIIAAFESPSVIHIGYGERCNWHPYTKLEQGRVVATLMRGESVQIGNHLLENGEHDDPSRGHPKQIVFHLERNGRSYEVTFDEQQYVHWGALWERPELR